MEEIIELQVKNISKHYPRIKNASGTALTDVSLTANHGEFISLIGPSGCGKSTLIKILAGLIDPTSGEVLDGNGAPANLSGNRGLVLQQYNLFPWLTVEENVGFGLEILKIPTKKQTSIISHYLEVVGLEGFGKAYPNELSGGMQQRASLARTLATNPKILLMDEPFAALDVQTKRFMQDLLLQIWEKEKRTIIFVTHDVEEAIFLSDTVYILSPHPGTIKERVEIDLPRPRNLKTEFSPKFVALKKHIQKVITKESLQLTKLNLSIYKNL